MNDFSRRRFLALAGSVPAALLASRSAVAAQLSPAAGRPDRYPIGLQMYSVRKALMSDLPGTLREVSRIGYGTVEFYYRYADWTIPYAKEVRLRMDDLGLRCHSTHNVIAAFTPGEAMAKAIEVNQILGNRYLILSSTPTGTKGVEGWKRVCGRVTTAMDTLRTHGLTAGFHNHQPEWNRLDGGPRAMDVIAANTPPDFALQFDVGTCMEMKQDPIAWIKANPGRIKIVHLKDWVPGAAADEKGYRVLFGEGVTPWAELTAAAESVGGVEYYLLEQEGSRFSEFETARRELELWRQFRETPA